MNRHQPPPHQHHDAVDTAAKDLLPRVIRSKACRELLSLSNGSFYARQDPRSPYFDQHFPVRIQLGERAVGYLASDIAGYLNALKKRRQEY